MQIHPSLPYAHRINMIRFSPIQYSQLPMYNCRSSIFLFRLFLHLTSCEKGSTRLSTLQQLENQEIPWIFHNISQDLASSKIESK